VFSAGRPRQLQRIHAAGGTPTRITSLSGVVETVPQFLPDARHVLFHTQGTGVWVADLEGTQPPKKIRDSETPAVYGNGHLLFRQGTLLLAQAFDVHRFELTGDPIAVAKEVGEDPSYSVSPAGVLIFRPPVRTELTQLTWFTRQGQQERNVGARGAYQTLSLSPDGGRVAVEATDPRSGETSIWLIDAARSITERFTFTHGPDEFPVWSRDGSRIVFSSHRANRVGIFEKAATGGAERTLAVDASHSLDWSADGRYVLYLADEGGPTELLVALSTKGGDKPIPVVSDPGIRQAQFSPDGRWVTYSSDRSGRLEVYVTDFPAGKARWQISSAGGDQPRWPLGANEIVYLAPDGKLMSVPVKSGAAFEAGTPVPLFEVRTVPPSNRRHQYAVSANGQRFLVSALVGELGSQSTMTVVLNWPALLKK
jgi:dipeptidyl aminopeptidase/acylaminoacyl peptidase